MTRLPKSSEVLFRFTFMFGNNVATILHFELDPGAKIPTSKEENFRNKMWFLILNAHHLDWAIVFYGAKKSKTQSAKALDVQSSVQRPNNNDDDDDDQKQSKERFKTYQKWSKNRQK